MTTNSGWKLFKPSSLLLSNASCRPLFARIANSVVDLSVWVDMYDGYAAGGLGVGRTAGRCCEKHFEENGLSGGFVLQRALDYTENNPHRKIAL